MGSGHGDVGPLGGAAPTFDVERCLEHLQDEADGVVLYETLAEVEDHPRLKEVYRRLAEGERRHAAAWAGRLREAGVSPPTPGPSWRVRALTFLARRFGPAFVLPTISSRERRDSRKYLRPDGGADRGMAADESYHARVLSTLAGTGPGGLEGGSLARLEGRHRVGAGGNALRAAVLGANDGLLSNLSLLMGVAGAHLEPHAILVTGMAGLLAGASSMALGEWLSVQSARELAEGQIATERDEIRAAPDEEREELALIYQAKGLEPEQARRLAREIMADADGALDTLAREELGIDPASLGGSAWEAAGTSFALFAAGAILPVLPFFFLRGPTAIAAGLGVGVAALFAIGVITSLFTGRGVLFSGLRQLTFGLGAAALTYTIGHLLGVALAG